jgi:hypothetical protein
LSPGAQDFRLSQPTLTQVPTPRKPKISLRGICMRAKMQVLVVFMVAVVCAGMAFAKDFVATSLNNIIVGGQWSQQVSIRFQATTSAPLAAMRVYWIIANPSDREGYASGNAGAYTYTLRADSDGQPGTVLSKASMVQNELTENKRGNFPLICFPPTNLTKGSYYDVVVQNVASEPTVNWASLDFLWDPAEKSQTPDIQIWVSDEGGHFGLGDGGTFIGSPVALFYANGAIQGHGDIAVGSGYAGGLECGSAYGFPAALCQ